MQRKAFNTFSLKVYSLNFHAMPTAVEVVLQKGDLDNTVVVCLVTLTMSAN